MNQERPKRHEGERYRDQGEFEHIEEGSELEGGQPIRKPRQQANDVFVKDQNPRPIGNQHLQQSLESQIAEELKKHHQIKLSNKAQCRLCCGCGANRQQRKLYEAGVRRLNKDLNLTSIMKTMKQLEVVLGAQLSTSDFKTKYIGKTRATFINLDSSEELAGRGEVALPADADATDTQIVQGIMVGRKVVKKVVERQVDMDRVNRWMERAEERRAWAMKVMTFEALMDHAAIARETFRKKNMSYFQRSRSPSKVPIPAETEQRSARRANSRTP